MQNALSPNLVLVLGKFCNESIHFYASANTCGGSIMSSGRPSSANTILIFLYFVDRFQPDFGTNIHQVSWLKRLSRLVFKGQGHGEIS